MTSKSGETWVKPRRLNPGDRVALVAPASAFERDEFEAGITELARLGFEAVYDERVFDRKRFVAGDPARLERVLENLLDNAVSFSPPDAPIEVDVVGSDGRVSIAVSDHGPGIAPDSREKVFERFHSLRPAGEDFGSHSGLGLAIARTIVEAHYGTLTAEDRSDGQAGARLVIDLLAWDGA